MTDARSDIVPAPCAAEAADETDAPPQRPGTAYRAYALDRIGCPPAYVEIEADDDAQAVALARVLGALYPVALWCGACCLGRFAPEDAPEEA